MGYLDGLSIAVTGAGRGIGRAVAMAAAVSYTHLTLPTTERV